MENPYHKLDAPHTEKLKRVVKGLGKTGKLLLWFLFLKAQRAVEKLLFLICGVSTGTKKAEEGRFLFRFLTGFLILAVSTLAFELVGHWNGWHAPELDEFRGMLHATYLTWISFRVRYIAYPIQALSYVFIILFIIQSLDKLMLCLGCFWIMLRNIKFGVKGGDPFESNEADSSHEDPMVLVQIPMCNEREVYQQSISAACQLEWPKDRLLIQVLDDSNDEIIKSLIRAEVSKWNQRGINIIYRHRLVRTGYKAGNLKSAMSCEYVKDYEFVAIFDADFQPRPDFLKRTIPHFKDNPELGLVQARWALVNRDVNFLTRVQYINMCYHFEVEQQVNGVFLGFFGFNGTAGVWRIKALDDSGGWLERTTVEDMDIAVRAHLNGWKFIFLNDVQVLCEVPESYEAYRKQQQRWHSGPMHLFRLCLPDILKSKLSIWKKGNLVLLFFLLRKLIIPCYSFVILCIVLPLTMFIPEAELPLWFVYYVPFILSLLIVFPSPSSLPLLFPYILFENTMAATKFSYVMAGLFKLRGSYEWVVTKKAGRTASETNSLGVADKEPKVAGLDKFKEQNEVRPLKKRNTNNNRIYRKELTLALFLLTAAARSLLSAHRIHFYFLLSQGVASLIVGLGLIGEHIS